ncbi:DUF1127 domain-containing protein [Paenirhodobacter populi]|uniref:DUF1127 domain-containing protein n=1 Tax=Paenirhodobacter populi TaxID=2306993 RepID=A0A443JHX0_9RHOB|nr:DUF1127 domain-containing protein [Sinirhodobacter populi]RWR20108.1 DUF1127 domain-containing protein [Sinirhodobacter populi]
MIREYAFSGIRLVRRPVSILRRIVALRALRRQRLSLAQLDAHLLDDIGVEWSEAKAEAARRLWDAPQHWFDRGGRY